MYIYIYIDHINHTCELTRIEWVSTAFQTAYPQKSCCSISPAFFKVTRLKTTLHGRDH